MTIHPPTFGGLPYNTYVSITNSFDLVGECDRRSKGLQYSYDEKVWMEVISGCVSGAFTQQVFVIAFVDVYVRSRTDGGYTKSGRARIKWGGPTGTYQFQLVTSGQIDPDGAAGTASMIDSTFTKATMTNGTYILKPSMIDAVYGP